MSKVTAEIVPVVTEREVVVRMPLSTATTLRCVLYRHVWGSGDARRELDAIDDALEAAGIKDPSFRFANSVDVTERKSA